MKSTKKSVRPKNGAAPGGMALLHEGIKFAKNGNKVEAKELLLKACDSKSYIEGGGENVREAAMLWLASLSDDMNDAAEYLRTALEINPDNDQARIGLSNALLRLGATYSKNGDKGGARAVLLESSNLNPVNEPVWLWLATVADEKDDIEQWLRKALDINPFSQRAIKWLTLIEESRKKSDPEQHLKDAELIAEAAILRNEEAGQLRSEAEFKAVDAETRLSELEARYKEETEKYNEVYEQLNNFESEQNNHLEELKQAEFDKKLIDIEREHAVYTMKDIEQKISCENLIVEEARSERLAIEKTITETAILILEAQDQLKDAEVNWKLQDHELTEEPEKTLLNLNGNAPHLEMTDEQNQLLIELKSLADVEKEMTEAALVAATEADKRRVAAEAAYKLSEEKYRERLEGRDAAEKAVKQAHEEFTRSLAAKRDAENARAEAEAELRKENALREEAESKLIDARAAAEAAITAKAEAQERLIEVRSRLDSLTEQLSDSPEINNRVDDFFDTPDYKPAFEPRTVDIPSSTMKFSMPDYDDIHLSPNNPATLQLTMSDVELKFKPAKFVLALAGIIAVICILYYIENV